MKSFLAYKFIVLAVVLATLAKLALILNLGLRSISKRITRLIFLNIYSLPKQALTHNSLCVKIIDKANSKFDLKIKEALYINWKKTNLNAQQNHLALTLSLQLLFSLSLSAFVFLFLFFISFIYCFHYLYANYRCL